MLDLKPALCTECQICMEICSFSHFGEGTTKRARIWVDGEWPKMPNMFVCLDCVDRECVEVCPTRALSYDKWIRLDKEACIECRSCADVCPVDGIRMDPITNNPLICDTCEGNYQCVQWCPTHAVERKS